MMFASIRRQEGQAMVEFALVLTVFLMMVLSIVEAGRLLLQYEIVAHAAEEGARYGSMHGNSCKTLLNGSCELTGDDIKTYVLNQWPTLTVVVTWPTPANPGTTVVVQVSSTFSPVAWFLANLPTTTLSNTARMVIAQ